jgi:integrase
MAKLVIALVAIHGLGKNETSRLLLDDLDLQAGTLTIRRDLARHTVYFDELTHSLAIAWLRERRRPRPPHARVRHRRQDRHEVRLHSPPRTAIFLAPIATWNLAKSSPT